MDAPGHLLLLASKAAVSSLSHRTLSGVHWREKYGQRKLRVKTGCMLA